MINAVNGSQSSAVHGTEAQESDAGYIESGSWDDLSKESSDSVSVASKNASTKSDETAGAKSQSKGPDSAAPSTSTTSTDQTGGAAASGKGGETATPTAAPTVDMSGFEPITIDFTPPDPYIPPVVVAPITIDPVMMPQATPSTPIKIDDVPQDAKAFATKVASFCGDTSGTISEDDIRKYLSQPEVDCTAELCDSYLRSVGFNVTQVNISDLNDSGLISTDGTKTLKELATEADSAPGSVNDGKLTQSEILTSNLNPYDKTILIQYLGLQYGCTNTPAST